MGACSEAFLHLLLFTVVLPLFTFLVASLFRLLLFSVLTRASQGLFTLFCERFLKKILVSFSFFAGLSSTQLLPYWFCSHQFAELGSIHCLAFSARACSLAFVSIAGLF